MTTRRFERDEWVTYHETNDAGHSVLCLGEVKAAWDDDRLVLVDDWDTWEPKVKYFYEVEPARVRVTQDLVDPDTGEIVAEEGDIYDPHCPRFLHVFDIARDVAALEGRDVTYANLVAAGKYKPGDIVEPPSCDAARATIIRDITPAGEETPHYRVRLDNEEQTEVEYSEDDLQPVGWKYR